MDKTDKRTLQVNYVKLCDGIGSEIDRIVDYIYAQEILTKNMREEILCRPTPYKKTSELLDFLPTRGRHAFKIFYDAAINTEMWDVADILCPSNGPHGARIEMSNDGAVEDDEPLPENWPAQEHFEDVSDLKLKVKKVQENQHDLLKYFQTKNQKYYEMSNKRCALIINNEVFTNWTEQREGSHQDVKGLDLLFQGLGFETLIEQNKTKQEMIEILNKECRRDFTEYSCFILVILSHGRKGVVFGTDGLAGKENDINNSIEIDFMTQKVSAIPSLAGKPKVFFFQTCQGNKENMGLEIEAMNNSAGQEASAVNSMTATWKSISDAIKHKATSCESQDTTSQDCVDASQSERTSRPEKADVYTALATTEGNLSYRNTAFGSWFIQAIIRIFADYAYKDDIATLMTKVTQLVLNARNREEMQVCQTKSTLAKRILFYPGLPFES